MKAQEKIYALTLHPRANAGIDRISQGAKIRH